MTSIATSAAETAHHWAASLLAKAQIKPGDTIPAVQVKESAPDKPEALKLTGKSVIVGVPGAFSGTCSGQIPGYIKAYDEFKKKGISEVYVVAVNDVFVMKAWKEQLAPSGTQVKFIADDKAALVSALGLVLDATALFGGPRAKRFVVIADGDKVESVTVEPNPGEVTGTHADKILSAALT